RLIAEARRAFIFDPRELEQSEERLFALRALARKHKCAVDDLAARRDEIESELQALSDGGKRLDELERAERVASEVFIRSAPAPACDEIDTGVGGAIADAIGIRRARLAKGLQVLAVTHSPQVAARADKHFLISKMEEVGSRRMVTRVQLLSPQSRREEIARML